MSLTAVRSQVAIFLILVVLAGTLPAGYAGSGPVGPVSPQRRGKNGAVPSQPGGQAGQAPTVESKQSRNEAQPDSKDASSGSDQRPSAGAADVADKSKDRADRGPVAPAVTETQSQSRKRPEPPPFDRPTLGSDERSATGGQSAPDSPQSSRSPQASRGGDAGRSSSQTSGADHDPAARGRSSEPELRRPADSRNPQRRSEADADDPDRGRSQKPVLRKPSDGPEPDEDLPGPRSNRAQQNVPGAVSNDKDEVLRLDATLVNMPILVSDRSGRYVPQLSARDFVLYEDGAQQEVAFFGNEEVPFNVALVLDMSPSVQGSNDHIHDAAVEFVRQLRPDDKVMVVSFDRRVRFLTDLTNNRRVLESAIRSTSTGSGTSVYDAVYEVVDRLRSVDGRKALILFSDGEDTTSSQASYDEAIDIVTESDVLVYGLRYPGSGGGNIRINPWPRSPIPQIPFPIPWPWPWPRRRRGPFTNYTPTAAKPASAAATSSAQNWPRRGRDFMAEITAAGGGPVYDADQITDLSRLATRMAEELRHVYVISYYPTNSLSNGGFRTIRVRVKGRDELAVRHRRGYNARDVKRGT